METKITKDETIVELYEMLRLVYQTLNFRLKDRKDLWTEDERQEANHVLKKLDQNYILSEKHANKK